MAPRRLALLALLAACDHEPPVAHEPAPPVAAAPVSPAVALPALPRAASPRYDQLPVLATHNAYWADRQAPGDLFGSGISLRVQDQLAFAGVRALELDIHTDPAHPHEFRVYHTVPGNSLCDSLRDCLDEVNTFAWAAPQHDPITLVVELKQLFAANFDAGHRIDDLDRVLREQLGAALFTPADLLARCPGDTTLAACVTRAGWPSRAQLRGRVLVTLLGNWDEFGAQATLDWLHYATAPIHERVAFPMACAWKLDASELPDRIAAQLTQADLDRALAQSAFLQVEVMDDPHMPPFLAAGGVVRANGADGDAAQQQRLALGISLLQTDTPWRRAAGVGPDTHEPGPRQLLSTAAAESVFAYHDRSEPVALQAIVTAGRSPAAGCLRAATALDARDAITVCRQKFIAPGPDNQRLTITVETCRAGTCTTTRDLSHEPAPGGPGDLVALTTDTHGCVQARSGRRPDAMIAVGPPWCPTTPPRLRGLFVPAAAEPTTIAYFGLATPVPFTTFRGRIVDPRVP